MDTVQEGVKFRRLYLSISWIRVVLKKLYRYVVKAQLFVVVEVEVVKESMCGVVMVVEVIDPVSSKVVERQTCAVI